MGTGDLFISPSDCLSCFTLLMLHFNVIFVQGQELHRPEGVGSALSLLPTERTAMEGVWGSS